MQPKPIAEFQNLAKTDKNICFLYSAQNGKSLLAKNPQTIYSGDNLIDFQKFAKKHQNKLLIGYFSYDLAYQLHNIKPKAKDDLKLPKIYFLAFNNWEEFETSDNENIPNEKQKTAINFKTTITKKNYKKSYEKIKDYIKKGEVYQLNLTHRLEAQTKIPPRDLFLKVIQKNPVDYLAYLEGHDFEILSASPERFIKTEGDYIETCPIKGTRPRGKTQQEDKKLTQELLKSPKETAELNMITDLLRNDLHKICKVGTVKVQGHRLLQKCPTVWHTYSKITGKLATTPLNALISMLPGGSITGCPKKRAIEIIDELEPKMRGVYTGVIGYIKPHQSELNFNIAIRTIIKKKTKLYLQVGGGIVIDSKNQDEYQETLDKAKSFTAL
ncbi:MAG: chorismate-binding protein [Patescibacteria group bacterium]|mgnify:CR=1 FL=1